jgi:hypothetical protein
MNDLDKIKWGFVLSVIGIALGWVLNQAGQWFRTRQDDKKVLNQVLFNLLEAYFIFSRCDIDLITKTLTNKMLSFVPKDQMSDEVKAAIHAQCSSILGAFITPELMKELRLIQVNYQNSIRLLAAIDPIRAYHLSGKTHIMDRFDSIHNWVAKYQSENPNEVHEIEGSVSQVVGALKPTILEESLKDIEKDIRGIAWKISPLVYFKSRRAMAHLVPDLSISQSKDIDTIMAKISPIIPKSFPPAE